jgi:hypothetical protein
MLFVWLYRLFPSIAGAFTIIRLETVIGWHRAGVKAWWRWKSCIRGGRPKVDRELRELIHPRIASSDAENRAPKPQRLAYFSRN